MIGDRTGEARLPLVLFFGTDIVLLPCSTSILSVRPLLDQFMGGDCMERNDDPVVAIRDNDLVPDVCRDRNPAVFEFRVRRADQDV